MDPENSPIEINTAQLMDWLVSRRHIPKDYKERLRQIGVKVRKAVSEMPAEDGRLNTLDINGQRFVTYSECQKIVNIFKESGEAKNVFGQFKSERAQKWVEIVNMYQKDNIYLAETASRMVQHAVIEIPSLKREMNKLIQKQADCEKKIKECDKSEAASLKKFKASCEMLDIEGGEAKSELLERVKLLPQAYEEMACKLKMVKPALEFYKAFNKYLSGQDVDVDIMPTLLHVIENGNTTTYEYIYREKPVKIEEPQLSIDGDTKSPEKDDNEIDFGDLAGANEGEEIDFGDQIVIESPENVEVTVGSGSSRGSLNEGTFVMVSYDDVNLEESGIVVEKSGQKDGIARGDEAFTILDNPKYRERVLNDLWELEAFLKMRIFEMSHESDLLSMSQMQNAPTVLQMQTLETVTALADGVNVAITQMTQKKIQHLHNMKHSPNYMDILLETLNQYAVGMERNKVSKNEQLRKYEEIRKAIKNLDVGIKWLIRNTKQMQRELEDELKQKYNGRTVYIVGSVNAL